MATLASGASIGGVVALGVSLAASPPALAGDGAGEQAIIDGAVTEAGTCPATGALLVGRRLRCTATLISPDVAITAAHCLRDGVWGDLAFTLDSNLEDRLEGVVGVWIAHAHPGYRDFETEIEATRIGRRDDIGIVILDEPIEDAPVEVLDTRGAVAIEGSELSMCGYGRMSWSLSTSGGLKQEALLTGGSFTPWELETTEDGPQPCRGDSGAPIFVETPAGRRIVGLVSRALGTSHMCDDGAIHTRVAPYADWIEDASRDRDEGCSAAGPGGAGPAGIALLLFLLRRRRSAAPRA